MALIRAGGYCYALFFAYPETSKGSGVKILYFIPHILCLCSFSIPLSVLAGKNVDFRSKFTGVEDIAAQAVVLHSSKGVHNIVQFVGILRIPSDCTVNPVKAFLVYSLSV